MPASARPLRVHVLIDSLTWGGAEMLLADLASAARSVGITLSVGYLNELDGSPASAGLRAHGIEPQLVPARRLLEPAAILRLRAHLAGVRPDIVHTHLELSDVLGSVAARALGIPSVSTVHLVAGQPTGQPADATSRGRLKARLAAFVRRHAAARVIAVSDAARAAYLSAGWDLPGHVQTVRNGIARSVAPGAGEKLRRELTLPADALVVSIVGVLRPGKGHEVACEAVRRLVGRFPSVRLLVVGDGPAREHVRRLAAPLGDAALFTGHCDDVMAVLALTDVLVHPTLMDAFPTALLEAAAARVPVVATSVGGIPEIVEDGRTGLLIQAPPSPDALAGRLVELLADAPLRRQLGEGAHARFVQLFTAERWAQRLRGVYDDVLAGGVRAG